MHLFFILVFFLQALFADAAVDSPVLHGKLKNGMAYYVKENNHPKGRAYLQLVVKVGSIYEESHEQGIAHFLEHLNFRGSEHFADGEMTRYLDTLGSYERNALTGFDLTIYHLDVPIEKEGAFDNSLLIMKDFAGFALLKDEPIAKERHVVLDEMYQGFSSSNRRLSKKMLATTFPGSRLVERFPIGTPEVISTVTPETLRAFYKKWYRPDRMAVMVVGDFDGKEVEQKVQKLFGSIINPEEEVEEPDAGMVLPETDSGSFIFDEGLDRTGFALTFFTQQQDRSSIPLKERMKKEVIDSCIIKLLSDRLAIKKEDGQFYDVSFQGDSLIHFNDLELEVQLFENRVEEGARALFQELDRIKLFGFTEPELQSWKQRQKLNQESLMANLDKLDHEASIKDLMDHFLLNDSLLTESEKDALAAEAIEGVTLGELNAAISESIFNKPYTAFLYTPSPQLKEALEGVNVMALAESNEPLSPFVCNPIELMIEPQGAPGTIENVKIDEVTQVAEWTLSNGIKVLVKKTDLEHNKVYLSAIAKGGLSQFSEEDLPSAAFASWGVDRVKGLSNYEKKLFLKSRGIDSKFEIDGGMRSVDFSVGNKNLETVFQLVHNVFTDPRFEESSLKKLLLLDEESQKQAEKTPKVLFSRLIKQVTSGNHYYFQKTDLSKVDPEKVKEAFYTLFGRPADFSFIIIGDYDNEEVANLVKKYIASLPVVEKKETKVVALPSLLADTNVKQEFVFGNQTYARCHVNFSLDLTPILQKDSSLTIPNGMVHLLRQRLWNVLRAEHGKTYGSQVKLVTPFGPEVSFAQLQVEFTCQPEDRHFMVDLVLQEVGKLKNQLKEEEVASLRVLFTEGEKESVQFNRHWIDSLKFAELYGVDRTRIFDVAKDEQLLTAELIEEAAKNLLDSSGVAVFYHLPEN